MLANLVNYFGDGTQTKFAEKLGIPAQNVSAWIKRGTFNAELIYAKCRGVSADWLLTGEGDMLRAEASTDGQSAAGSHNQVNGEGAHHNTNSHVESDALLKEQVASLKAVLAEKDKQLEDKERTIRILMEQRNK